jgi:hypothetical protein
MLSCFWALLTCEDLNFSYISPSFGSDMAAEALSYIKSSTLYNLMHPDEKKVARRDIAAFISTQPLNSTLTR